MNVKCSPVFVHMECAGTQSGASDVAVIVGLLWIWMDVIAQVPAESEETIPYLTLFLRKLDNKCKKCYEQIEH